MKLTRRICQALSWFDGGHGQRSQLGRCALVCLAVSSVGFLSISRDCHGYVTELEISQVRLIYNERNEFRVLLGLETPNIPESFRIDFASIVIPKSQDSSKVSLEVYELSRSWSTETVGWGYP